MAEQRQATVQHIVLMTASSNLSIIAAKEDNYYRGKPASHLKSASEQRGKVSTILKKDTYAEVAVKISTFLAWVTKLKHRAKQAVNTTRIARRANILDTK